MTSSLFAIKTRKSLTRVLLAKLVFLALSAAAQAASPTGPTGLIDTNVARCENAPLWLKAGRVERVADQMQGKLEWDIRKIRMVWHPDQAEFLKAHGFDSSVVAFSLKTDNSVHLGPAVTSENFDTLFGHELVHIILYQKYKGAVPKWLEEGLANYLSNNRRGSLWKVDYSWLATQPPRDVLTLGHPFKGAVQGNARFHYQASHALMEMIASHCTVTDLLQLSVSKKLESYLPTLCEISDVNAEFRKWVARKAKAAGP